jgi:parvulin-like peptidyl-prolyl isomerase
MTDIKKPFFSKSEGARRRFSLKPKTKNAKTVSDEKIPRITTDNVSKHREEVLSGAKKYVYPLKHSRHKIVIVSVSITVAVFIGFMSYTIFNLYKAQNTSKFTYQVTKIIHFPVARIGNDFVAYKDYLYELRRLMHYFETQQNVDFSSQSGKDQLAQLKATTMKTTLNNAYIKRIAKQKGIAVSNAEVDKQITLLKSQNRLGGDNKTFENVLKDYYGWSVNDFRGNYKNELLKYKVIQSLDPSVQKKANSALADIKSGKSFADVAKQYSDDQTTNNSGGKIGATISKSDRSVSAQVSEALFNLKPGETSGIVDLGYGLAIVKNDSQAGDKINASWVYIAYRDIDSYLNDYKDQQKARVYIKV